MNIDDILIACGDECDYCNFEYCTWDDPWILVFDFRMVVQEIAYDMILDGQY